MNYDGSGVGMLYEGSAVLVQVGSRSVVGYFGIDISQFLVGIGYKPNIPTHECDHCTIISDVVDIHVGPFIFGLEIGKEKDK